MKKLLTSKIIDLNIYYYLVLFGVAVILFGCQKSDDFLDQKVETALNKESVFSDSTRTLDFLGGLYKDLNAWHGQPYDAGSPERSLTGISGESDGRYPSAGMLENNVTTGAYGGEFSGWTTASWNLFYKNIRAANLYIQNVDNAPFSKTLKERTTAEARFLKVYYYSLLVEGWGGIPIVGDTIFTLEDLPKAERSSFSDCVEFIINELDEIASQLPTSYSGLNYGRITRGACLALKSRLLLFAASPLYNGENVGTGDTLELTGYTSADPQRWQRAYDAAKAVVDLGVYGLEMDNTTKPGYGFYSVFQKRVNSEYILTYMMEPNHYLEQFNLPPTRANWDGYNRFPTQEMVDAFPMVNGLSIDDAASGYNDNNPYQERDPRFYFTIIYNGAEFYRKNDKGPSPVWTYVGAGADAIVPISSGNATHTGYYWRKMMHEEVNFNSGSTDRCLPILRYAEILLNLAEAANEIGSTELAMDQIKLLRERAGIEKGVNDRYGLPSSPSKEEARKIIHNERFIELAFEGKRFWDMKRWKRFAELQNNWTHGMEITKNGDDYVYKRIKVRELLGFGDILYHFRITEAEIANNRKLIQNPGW